jgi:hypothetical protein
LRDSGLWWYSSFAGRYGGAIIGFLRHPAIAQCVGNPVNAEHCSRSTRNTVPFDAEHCSLPNTDTEYRDQKSAPAPDLGSSLPAASSKVNAKSRGSFFEGDQHHDQPVQNHVKWPEFVAWCTKRGGTPTVKGFWTWLSKQKPQWRNRVKEPSEQNGYVLEGKFYSREEANQHAMEEPELATKFRPAVKRNGTIQILDNPGSERQDATQKSNRE